jgi:PHS family inorganic phosphate transporter-like MFS transporter
MSSLEIVKMIYSDASVRRKLAATGLCWFFFDVLNYGIGLISPEILAKITHDTGDITSSASIRELSTLTLGTMALSFPGTLLTIYLLPSLGIKRLQVWGFAILASFCLLLGVVFKPLANDEQALFGIYCLVCVAMSFGIAVSTYTLPALVFERDKRATMNGVCAAMGKCGAVVGSYSFGSIARSSSSGFTIVLLLCFASAAVSTVISQVYIDVPLPELSCCSSSTTTPLSSNEDANESVSVSEIEVISVIHDN